MDPPVMVNSPSFLLYEYCAGSVQYLLRAVLVGIRRQPTGGTAFPLQLRVNPRSEFNG